MDTEVASANDKLLDDGSKFDFDFDSEKVEADDVDKEGDDVDVDVDDDAADELSALLSPKKRGGISRKKPPENTRRRKVQWNDRAGDKLFEILEFQPSDASDTDEDDDSDSCICSVM